MPGAAANDDPRPFLTLIAFPDGFDHLRTARLLADEAAFNEPTLRVMVGREPPCIVGQCDPDQASIAIQSIVSRGGDAIAPTFSDLAALGPSRPVKHLELESGHLIIDLWRGARMVINREDVEILVRAHLSTTATQTDFGALERDRRMSGVGLTGYSLGAGGLAVGLAAGYALSGSSGAVSKKMTTSDRLDIHTRDGVVYQVNGDKFGYQVLGQQRGHSDKVNMDRLCDLLAHVCPDEIVDPYFSLWKPPAGANRLPLKPHDDSLAFAFYSRWAALMYRHLKRG